MEQYSISSFVQLPDGRRPRWEKRRVQILPDDADRRIRLSPQFPGSLRLIVCLPKAESEPFETRTNALPFLFS